MVKEEKLKAVEELKGCLEKSPVVGVIDIHKMPSKQLQEIRKMLRGEANIKIVKKIILRFAIEGAKKDNIKSLENVLPTQPGLILTDMDAFKIFSKIMGMKFKTFAKEGDVAKEDIWAYAGPTSLMAGPAISEFQQAGVPASIESGKITIRKDALVVKAGETISAGKANVLRKLKIEPMEILLDVVAIYQKGEIVNKDALKMVLEFPKMLPSAFINALNLSVYIAYPTKENISQLLAKASMAGKAIESLAAKDKSLKSENKQIPESAREDGNSETETPSENGGAN